jgi:hypothetical protein
MGITMSTKICNFFETILNCMQEAMKLRAELYVKTRGWE